MKIGKLVKVDENSWVIKSEDAVHKIDPYHSFWLKIWGEEGLEFKFELNGDLARIQNPNSPNSSAHPTF